jgi:hypothetical protein
MIRGSNNRARLSAKNLLPSFNVVALAPRNPRIDTRMIDPDLQVLTGVLVSDYLESPDIRRTVDEALPPRDYRAFQRQPPRHAKRPDSSCRPELSLEKPEIVDIGETCIPSALLRARQSSLR